MEFVGVSDMVGWLAATGVEQAIAGIAGFLEADLRRWPTLDLAPRVADYSPLGVIELMPVSDSETYAVKYVNGHPANPARGLLTVTAFGVLADVSTGYPVLLAEMTLLTALRTAATSAVAAAALARPDCRRLALIGAGSQAEFQALALRSAALGIGDVVVWDTDPAAAAKVQRNLEPLGFTVTVSTSARAAVRGADVVTTCTADKAVATVLPAGWVEPGMHVNAIGGDCPGKTELDPAVLRDAAVFVEFAPQTRIEGEIQALGPDFPVTELWEMLTGRRPGRTTAEQVTVFDSVGCAVEDFSALRYLRDAVRGTPWVKEIDLVPEPDDPKDLFGMVTAASRLPA
ncbi:ornithine cyclodeaminase [Blastococcus sp. TF02-09]|uniref:ornithine cyclodeaminase n=1 Tax=Blastococcus sp. TF02-09 TaxID=2250576 RepID=UPI000DEAE8C9|nr:ornithine cyclodeaminase [Blastococcus sp. TF02-9]RBY79402.1 ornithine cyclodeaminase [Blastococcus sp. TF02-9]